MANVAYDAAIVAAVGAVVAAGVSSVGLVVNRRWASSNEKQIVIARDERNATRAQLELLVDATHQAGQRLDHIAARADDAQERLGKLQVAMEERRAQVDELTLRTATIESKVETIEAKAEHIEAKLDQHIRIAEPFLLWSSEQITKTKKEGT